MAKRKTAKKKPSDNGKVVYEIEGDKTYSFPLKDDGKLIGTVEDKLHRLHRHAMSAQADMFDADADDWVPYFAQILREEYKIPKVTENHAYRIGIVVLESFDVQKKS